jgi:hypothetical protein
LSTTGRAAELWVQAWETMRGLDEQGYGRVTTVKRHAPVTKYDRARRAAKAAKLAMTALEKAERVWTPTDHTAYDQAVAVGWKYVAEAERQLGLLDVTPEA